MSDEGTDRDPRAHTALSHLVSDARTHATTGETGALLEVLETVGAVSSSELPEGDLRERVLFGRSRVEYHAGADPEVAVEYLRSMERLLDEPPRSND